MGGGGRSSPQAMPPKTKVLLVKLIFTRCTLKDLLGVLLVSFVFLITLYFCARKILWCRTLFSFFPFSLSFSPPLKLHIVGRENWGRRMQFLIEFSSLVLLFSHYLLLKCTLQMFAVCIPIGAVHNYVVSKLAIFDPLPLFVVFLLSKIGNFWPPSPPIETT